MKKAWIIYCICIGILFFILGCKNEKADTSGNMHLIQDRVESQEALDSQIIINLPKIKRDSFLESKDSLNTLWAEKLVNIESEMKVIAIQRDEISLYTGGACSDIVICDSIYKSYEDLEATYRSLKILKENLFIYGTKDHLAKIKELNVKIGEKIKYFEKVKNIFGLAATIISILEKVVLLPFFSAPSMPVPVT